jgi:Zn finger protein HypA/HybF involved in hydrogenase expression
MSQLAGFRCRACNTPIEMQPGQIGTCSGCGRKNYAPASGYEYFTAVPTNTLPGEIPPETAELSPVEDEVIVCAKCKKITLAPPGATVRCPSCGEPCHASMMDSIVELVPAPGSSNLFPPHRGLLVAASTDFTLGALADGPTSADFAAPSPFADQKPKAYSMPLGEFGTPKPKPSALANPLGVALLAGLAAAAGYFYYFYLRR